MEDKHYIIDSFSVENFLSIKEKQTIFFDSTVKAFYGDNASGKSNLYKAMLYVRRFIKESTDPDSHGTHSIPFLLSEATRKKPSSFSVKVHCLEDKTAYEYTFSATTEKVTEEEMYDLSSSRPRLVFKRSNGSTEGATRNGFNKKMFEGDEAVRDDSLLITFARSTKNQYANAIYDAMSNISYIDLSKIDDFRGYAVNILQRHPEYRKKFLDFLKGADLPISDFSYNVSKITPDVLANSPFNEKTKQYLLSMGQNVTVNTVHAVRDEYGNKVDSTIFDIDTQESLGTNYFFNLAVAVIDTIERGRILYIDEFGASMHTDLCKYVIDYFFKQSSRSGAKLILNTHDIGLIKNGALGILEAKNISIVERDKFDSTIITPLENKVGRSDENVGKKYALGIYGGVPILDEVA